MSWFQTHPLRFRLLTCCAAIFMAGMPASAQDAPPAAKPATQSRQPWVVNCNGEPVSGKLLCVMSETLLSQQNGQKIVSVAIGPDEKEGMVARLNLPHGIDLTKGVAAWVDQGQQETIAIRSADERGSYATMPMTEARLAAFRKGSTMSVAVQTTKGEKIVFEISLTGFAAAFAKL